ncbi:membrane protein insertase YidC [Saccharibacillus sp. CPCC 101409]|uniref:membrane protein insertase YidC n=1 Tax=Saccharibacillus sp. CPCC 101409 TaxID=3058041 RepID=UPI002673636A|nr:membrane protein insertase YidC [Saccharibacillus sp. CPCC 101409]MDO3412176.1 membrane protein insertase YidC [Saccharibacillus sp. CPCC 101409]
MENAKGFIFKSAKGKFLALTAILGLMALLSGCGVQNGEITSSTPGFFNHYVVFPISYLIQHLAQWTGGSYGIGIILITLIVRLVLFPLMLRQTRSQQQMKAKMNVMQPHLDALKKKYEDKKDAAEQQKMQQEMMALYKEHNFNPLNIGCLPMLIQLPILSGLYTAIRLTPELSTHSFLWFKLGQPDWILAILVAVIYLVQAKVSQYSMTPEQRKQMAIMAYISPLMMLFFSFSAPSAMPLYWTVSGTFLLAQTLLFRKMYPAAPALDAAPVDTKPSKPVKPAKA